jgi:hypothetical protein
MSAAVNAYLQMGFEASAAHGTPDFGPGGLQPPGLLWRWSIACGLPPATEAFTPAGNRPVSFGHH